MGGPDTVQVPSSEGDHRDDQQHHQQCGTEAAGAGARPGRMSDRKRHRTLGKMCVGCLFRGAEQADTSLVKQ